MRLLLAMLALLAIGGCDRPDEATGRASEAGGGSRLSRLLTADPTDNFLRAIEPRSFSFPHDHAAHPGFRNEWWYFTGILRDAASREFGFEITFFRFRLPGQQDSSGEPADSWRQPHVIIIHFAVSDIENDRFYHEERMARQGAGVAGFRDDPISVYADNWILQNDGDEGVWRIEAASESIAINLALKPSIAPILNGENGLSRKSATVGNASYYYSQPLLQTSGQLTVNGRNYEVAGTSWLDREWSSSALAADQQGWDWFALTLENKTTLMIYGLRNADGETDTHSGGTLRYPNGKIRILTAADFELDVLSHWQSPSGARYPAHWQLSVPHEQLSLDVRPKMANQELTGLVRYWEGAVGVTGTLAGEETVGEGYVELTGY